MTHGKHFHMDMNKFLSNLQKKNFIYSLYAYFKNHYYYCLINKFSARTVWVILTQT